VVRDPRQAIPLHGTYMGSPSRLHRNERRGRRHLGRRQKRKSATADRTPRLKSGHDDGIATLRAARQEARWLRGFLRSRPRGRQARGDFSWKSEWATS
jgi:hypothetical protein